MTEQKNIVERLEELAERLQHVLSPESNSTLKESFATIKELAGALGEARPIVARAYVSDRGRQHDGRVMRQIDALLSRLSLEGGE